jgi:hypothetical protein
LGFSSGGPGYFLPVLLRNAKPNNGRFRNRTPKVSISIKLVVFWASGCAYMTLREIGALMPLILRQLFVGAASSREIMSLYGRHCLIAAGSRSHAHHRYNYHY